MILGDFNINGFIGSKNKMMLSHRVEAGIPERHISFNENVQGVHRAIVFDDKNYKNRTFPITILIKSDSYEERVKLYTDLMSKLDTGRYVPAVFYNDEAYEYRIIRTSDVTTSRPGFFEEYEVLEFTVSAEPYKYVRENATAEVSGAEVVIKNPTRFTSLPHIKIVGSGDINLTINGRVYSFTGVTGSIELDSALQNVYRMDVGKAVNENAKMKLSPFPQLKAGNNTLSIEGGKATITPRWRTL